MLRFNLQMIDATSTTHASKTSMGEPNRQATSYKHKKGVDVDNQSTND